MASNALEVVVTGYYFDEIAGALSPSTLSLHSIAPVSDATINVNVLTTLEKPRVLALVASGQSLVDAKARAQSEVLAAFGISASGLGGLETLDISQAGAGNAILLAVSVILDEMATLSASSPNLVPAQLSTLLAAIAADLADGNLDDVGSRALISRASRGLDLAGVRASLSARYTSLGGTATIPSFEDYVDSNGNGVLNGSDPVDVGTEQVIALPVALCNSSSTLLLDGRVLLAGGMGQAALLFDPASNAILDGGQMTAARSNPQAALLPDAGVLIAGDGQGDLPLLQTAELFDPNSATFRQTGSMNALHAFAPATSLQDGGVLIAGGFDSNLMPLQTAEVYESAAASFSVVGSLNTARSNHTATALADGRVLIAGGTAAGNGPALGAAELFDPTTQTFSNTGSLNFPRTNHTATLLPDGTVLFVGGQTSTLGAVVPIGEAEIFDPSTGVFSVSDTLFTPRTSHAAALANGEVIVFGGVTNSAFTTSVEVFDPASGYFRRGGALSSARSYMFATTLLDGRVLLPGGLGLVNGSENCLGSASIWAP